MTAPARPDDDARAAPAARTSARAPSLRRALIGWIALGLALAITAAAISTYLRARDEANALFDLQLAQMAASVTGMPLAGAGPSLPPSAGAGLVVEVWTNNGVEVYLSQPQRPLPRPQALGYATVRGDGGEWRVYSVLAGGQVVQVAQPLAVRRELAADLALSTILPLLAVLPFLALFVWLAIARGLAPLDRLAEAVARRSPSALAPLPERGLPVEVQPLVAALNGLLARLDAAIDAQRAFIADAAHELRTPLTAVSLQAELAGRAQSDADRAVALAELRAGLDRATRLAAQLLTLAREEPDVPDRPFAPVDLAALAPQVIAEHVAQAAARRIDLGQAPVAGPAVVHGDAASLRTLLSNLVDNALRYTPEGGRVDVVVGTGRSPEPAGSVPASAPAGPTLTVADSGPGIPEPERARVFDRFYRAPGSAQVPGSGLGLAIVRRIALRHRATVALGPGLGGPAGPGLAVVVRFPPPP